MTPEMIENTFTVLNLLVPGLVLALFAAYYQTRKKNEIIVETEIAKVRIDAYERVIEVLERVIITKSPTLDETALIHSILEYFDLPDINVDYPEVFSDEASFDAFYQDLKDVGNECHIYFGYDVEKQFEESIGVYSSIKLYLDAFADAERKHTDKIRMAYMIASILMKTRINASFLKMEDLISEKLSKVEIQPKRGLLRRKLYNMMLPLYRMVDRNMHREDWKGKLSNAFLGIILGRERLMLMHQTLDLVDIMTYLHYSDSYTPSEWFEMSPEDQRQLHLDFMMLLYPQIHK